MDIQLLYNNKTNLLTQCNSVCIDRRHKMLISRNENSVSFYHNHIEIVVHHSAELPTLIFIYDMSYDTKYFNNTIADIGIDNVKKMYYELVEFYDYITSTIKDFGYLQIGTNELKYYDIHYDISYIELCGTIRIGYDTINLCVEFEDELLAYIEFDGGGYTNDYFTKIVHDLIPLNSKPTGEVIDALSKLMLEFINNFNCAVNNYKRVTAKSAK